MSQNKLSCYIIVLFVFHMGDVQTYLSYHSMRLLKITAFIAPGFYGCQ
jgi:hypothetical protein